MTKPDYFEMNRIGWDQRAKVHLTSKFYDVPGFLDGKSSLSEIDLAELREVSGRRLLHLQCHFGLDTLSWARLGAHVTGVDISPVAIEQANDLRDQAGLNAQFVCSNVYDYDRGDETLFDIVYTSFGAVCWLPDLKRWAHPFTDVVNALVGVGIQIEQLNEFAFSPYNCFENMQERQPGRFYLQHKGNDIPLVYSLRGRKLPRSE